MNFILPALLLSVTVQQFLLIYSQLHARYVEERRSRQSESMIVLPKLFELNLKWRIIKKRNRNWWENTVLHEFTDEDWLENFRMSHSTFQFICNRLEPYLKPCENLVRDCISVEKKVAMVLYKLSSCAEYRVVANAFGTHKSVVCKYMYEVCKAICSTFRDEFLCFPNGVEAEEISEAFEEMCGIPNIIAAIDGTHIPILPPKVGYRDFVNRKGWTSYNVLAAVDHLYRFRYATCKHPGCAHDAAVLRDSALFKNADNIIPKRYKTVNGKNIPTIVIGDPAYPLLPWLTKPYKGNITPEEESFNVYLSGGRVVVENASGRLKGRFRCLLKRIDINYTFVPTVVMVCIILHNILETRKERFQQMWLEAVNKANLELVQPVCVSSDKDVLSAAEIRQTLKHHIDSKYPLRSSRIS